MSAGEAAISLLPEDQGIFLQPDTVLCEDCRFIGKPLKDRCRKCTGASLTRLIEVVYPERSAEAQKGETCV